MKAVSLVLLMIVSFHESWAGSVRLNPLQLFDRCVAHFSQSEVKLDHALRTDVKNGKSAVDACMEFFDQALIADNSVQMSDPNSEFGQKIMMTMHRLHASWFETNALSFNLRERDTRGAENVYDATEPALYFTRSLFREDIPFKDIMTAQGHLRARRTLGVPTRPRIFASDTSDIIFGANTPYPQVGNLNGVYQVADGDITANYSFLSSRISPGNTISGTRPIFNHFGGGILGNTTYLLTSIREGGSNYKTDGGLKMPRKWSKSVFSDLLCRELPVLNDEDALPFVAPQSSIPFRQSKSCVKCHATIDRFAGVLRGFRYDESNVYNTDYPARFGHVAAEIRFHPKDYSSRQANKITPELSAESEWPTEPDTNYYRRPANGVLYYRDYQGSLVNVPVASIDELGAKLALQMDPYLCVASRYYSYFMGVQVKISHAKTKLSTHQKKHYDRVLSLARSLKDDSYQSLRSLIKRIISFEDYQMSDYGTSN